ncbi:MAG: hypothetical protein Q9225_004717 [Loekoesia sp. 1 TL-2023]
MEDCRRLGTGSNDPYEHCRIVVAKDTDKQSSILSSQAFISSALPLRRFDVTRDVLWSISEAVRTKWDAAAGTKRGVGKTLTAQIICIKSLSPTSNNEGDLNIILAIPLLVLYLLHETYMAQDTHFTVFIRCPFPRGDFVDPPPVNWDSGKDQTLWDILSRTSKGRHALADEFNVDLPFLLQQAAWLYERQLSQVKAQLRKVSKPSLTAHSPTPSSVSGSGIAGGHAMARTSSGGPRVPSSLAMRQKERPTSQGEGSMVGYSPPARGARMSRNSSTNTVYQVQKASPKLNEKPTSESPHMGTQLSRAREASRRLSDITPKERATSRDKAASPSSTADDSSASSSESDAAPTLSRSRAYLRRPRHPASKAPLGPLSDAEEDGPESPPLLPFSDLKATKQSPSTDPSATLRMAKRALSDKTTQAAPPLNSSSSSAQSQPAKPTRTTQNPNKNPISPPRGPHEPASALSPRQRRVVKDGSDGTPSMGSSFSDLDDASVTQSALEEALAHEMNQGGVASRMSTISQALRSRYL